MKQPAKPTTYINGIKTFKIKCTTNNTTLVLGGIYDAIDYNENHFLVATEFSNPGLFQKLIFEVCEDELSHECPCGIVRAQCDYHRIQ